MDCRRRRPGTDSYLVPAPFSSAARAVQLLCLVWATVALAMHPEWQDHARREVVAVCGRRGLPTKDHGHLPKLKTLGMIVNETLRLYPPAVAMVRRRSGTWSSEGAWCRRARRS
ncbi:cytochrome P450 734A5-like [Phragmites australis]|uniref:cytochrome P450 734A5-like n=1 Tax=Phragmites australis TaxID=29695 RepID=UPI002D7A2B79|nr:cytochrome P450 734A5-like [Phragmites australis]